MYTRVVAPFVGPDSRPVRLDLTGGESVPVRTPKVPIFEVDSVGVNYTPGEAYRTPTPTSSLEWTRTNSSAWLQPSLRATQFGGPGQPSNQQIGYIVQKLGSPPRVTPSLDRWPVLRVGLHGGPAVGPVSLRALDRGVAEL